MANVETTRYSVGTSVMQCFDDHGWFRGEIVSVDEDRYIVRYEDDDEEEYLFIDQMEELDEIVSNANEKNGDRRL